MQSFSQHFTENSFDRRQERRADRNERTGNIEELEGLLNRIDAAVRLAKRKADPNQFSQEEVDHLILQIGDLARALEDERLPERLHGRAGSTVTNLSGMAVPESVKTVIDQLQTILKEHNLHLEDNHKGSSKASREWEAISKRNITGTDEEDNLIDIAHFSGVHSPEAKAAALDELAKLRKVANPLPGVAALSSSAFDTTPPSPGIPSISATPGSRSTGASPISTFNKFAGTTPASNAIDTPASNAIDTPAPISVTAKKPASKPASVPEPEPEEDKYSADNAWKNRNQSWAKTIRNQYDRTGRYRGPGAENKKYKAALAAKYAQQGAEAKARQDYLTDDPKNTSLGYDAQQLKKAPSNIAGGLRGAASAIFGKNRQPELDDRGNVKKDDAGKRMYKQADPRKPSLVGKIGQGVKKAITPSNPPAGPAGSDGEDGPDFPAPMSAQDASNQATRDMWKNSPAKLAKSVHRPLPSRRKRVYGPRREPSPAQVAFNQATADMHRNDPAKEDKPSRLRNFFSGFKPAKKPAPRFRGRPVNKRISRVGPGGKLLSQGYTAFDDVLSQYGVDDLVNEDK